MAVIMKDFFTEVRTDYLVRSYIEKYERVGNWQRIKFTVTGKPFVTNNGRRFYLDNFIRCGSFVSFCEPFEITDSNGNGATLCGYEYETYYKPLFIEIDSDGEKARLFRYLGNEVL